MVMTSVAGEGRRGPRRRRLCVCTRIHQNNAHRAVDMAKVREFLDSALKYGDSVAIAVGPTPTTATENESTQAARTQDSLLRLISRAAREATDAHVGSRCGARYTEREGEGDAGAPGEGEEDGVRISVFEVTPWGKFTPALNALLGFAARDGADLVMFQSLETTVNVDAVLHMETHMGPDDLVVGAALTGHAFKGGETVQLTGVTTPWNTLAMWDVGKLARLGFLGVAEGLISGVAAGVEEVTAIATLQALLGRAHARAKLIRLPQVQWEAKWEDEGRRRWHESKMASKVERADKQITALGVQKGLVDHLG